MNLLDPDCGMDGEERREILLYTDAGHTVIAAEDAAFFAALFAEGLPPGWTVDTYKRGPNKHAPCLRKGKQVKPIPEGHEVVEGRLQKKQDDAQPSLGQGAQPTAATSGVRQLSDAEVKESDRRSQRQREETNAYLKRPMPTLRPDIINKGHRAYAEALREAASNSYSENQAKADKAEGEAATHNIRAHSATDDSTRHDRLATSHIAARRAEAYALENKLRNRKADAEEDLHKTNGQSLLDASNEMHAKYREHREKGFNAILNPDLRAAHEATAEAHARQRDMLNRSWIEHKERMPKRPGLFERIIDSL